VELPGRQVGPGLASDRSVPLIVSCPALQLFSNREGYTYSDYILLPGHINFDAKDVVLAAQVTKQIKIHLPFISSPMDTVRMAARCLLQASSTVS
jgi:hypothetical protein